MYKRTKKTIQFWDKGDKEKRELSGLSSEEVDFHLKTITKKFEFTRVIGGNKNDK